MKKFKFDGSFGDLGQFGIHCLTGESCAYGMRLPCDLTQAGAELIEDALGLIPRWGGINRKYKPGTGFKPDHDSFPGNWNGGTEADPHVASVHLFREMAGPVAIIGMFEVHGCDSVLVFDGQNRGTLVGLKLEGDEPFSAIQEHTARYAGRYGHDEATGALITVREPIAGYMRSITPIGHPRRGGFCVHAMTGRSL